MKDSLQPGVKISVTIEVDKERTIGFMGDEGRVYATPSMVEDFEYTCRNFLLDHLDDGEDTVGTHVSMDHLAPTVEGDKVTFEVEITEVDGRLVTMQAQVADSVEDVGRGIHKRFVVDTAKTFERLKAKRVKALGGS
ncbi:MAG: LysR family transcriptional regulator [Rhodospirillaceae bacterium]|mgnify:FL=1|nr:LysR family transcriptional regulator [Rhodospirillaceae bacterium]